MEKSYQDFLKMLPANQELKLLADEIFSFLKKKNAVVEGFGKSESHPAQEYLRAWSIRMAPDYPQRKGYIGIPETVRSLGLIDGDISLVYFNLKDCILVIFYIEPDNKIVGLILRCI